MEVMPYSKVLLMVYKFVCKHKYLQVIAIGLPTWSRPGDPPITD